MSSLPRISNAARRPSTYPALKSRIRRRRARSAASSQPDWFGASTQDLVSTDRDSTWRSTRLSTMVSQSVAPSSPRGCPRRSMGASQVDSMSFFCLGTALTLPYFGKDRPARRPRLRPPSHRVGVLGSASPLRGTAHGILEPAVAAAVCYILSVAYRSQLDQPAGYLQDCAQARSNRSRYLLDLRGLMAYNDAPALQYTSHRHHGFAVIQS